jgi:hypothetical protein
MFMVAYHGRLRECITTETVEKRKRQLGLHSHTCQSERNTTMRQLLVQPMYEKWRDESAMLDEAIRDRKGVAKGGDVTSSEARKMS